MFRRVSGAADSRVPGAAAGSSQRLSGPQAGRLESADPQTASVRHHQRPGRHQPDPEGVGQQDQVDVSDEQRGRVLDNEQATSFLIC